MIGRLRIGGLALAAANLLPTPTHACTPAEGYRTPTNFELVQKASLIVLARVVDGPDDPFGARPEVRIEPVRVLKGQLPTDPLRLMGSLKWNGRTVPSMPTTLATSHFSAGIGACVRLFYPRGGLVVAMFEGTDVTSKHKLPFSMTPIFLPFARTAEDVESADALWVRAVEAYVALQAGIESGQLREAAGRRCAELLAQSGDLAAQAMADDLTFYLDQTAAPGTPPLRRDGPRWRMVDLPDESVALIGSGTVKARILRCRAGGGALEVYWPQEEGAAKALRLGAQRFALKPAALTLSPEMKAASATVPFDAALRRALASATGDAGLDMAAGSIAAPPLDTLQKLALRCADLLPRPPAKGR